MDDAECGTHLGGRRPATSEQTDQRAQRPSAGPTGSPGGPRRDGDGHGYRPTPGLDAKALRGRVRIGGRDPVSTIIRRARGGGRVRTSEGGGGMEWKWKDGQREGNRGRQEEGREPPRRELPPPVGSVLVEWMPPTG